MKKGWELGFRGPRPKGPLNLDCRHTHTSPLVRLPWCIQIPMTSTIPGAILVEFSFYHRGHNRLTLSKDASLSLVERSSTATHPMSRYG
jgi:hypothetical protein